MARSSVGHNSILIVTIVVNDALQTLPGVLDVVEVSPQVAVFDDGGEVWLKEEKGEEKVQICMYVCSTNIYGITIPMFLKNKLLCINTHRSLGSVTFKYYVG